MFIDSHLLIGKFVLCTAISQGRSLIFSNVILNLLYTRGYASGHVDIKHE